MIGPQADGSEVQLSMAGRCLKMNTSKQQEANDTNDNEQWQQLSNCTMSS